MADKKTSLIEDISKNTKEIAKETKTFGPKLPSKSESTEQTEYMVESISEINDVLIGSFAHLIFGQSNKRKYSDLAGLVGKSADDTIFGNIRDIAKMIGAKKGTSAHMLGTQIANGIAKSKDYFTKLESSIKNGIKTSFTDLEIIKQLNAVNGNLESAKDTSSNNSLDSLIKDNNDKLDGIYKILEERSKSDVLKEIDVRLKSTGDLKSLVDLLKKISGTKITEQTHKTLNEIVKLTDKGGELDKIIQNTASLNQNADKVIKSTKGIESIKNIIQLLQNSISVSPIDVIRFRSNMFWIRHFVIKGLMKTINEMSELQDTTAQNQEAITIACKNFVTIFDLIQKSAEFGFWKSLKIRFNLMNLRDVIRNDFADTLNTIIKTLNSESLAKLGQYAEKRLQALQSFIAFLNEIVNDEKFDVYEISDRLESIQMLVENQLTNLMKSINDDLKVQKETTKFDSLQFNIESIRNLRDIMPTWLELLSMVYKTQLMLEFISKLTKASEEINKIPKITISKPQWADLTDKHIEGLINVGELVNSIDAKTYGESIKKNLIPYTKDIISLFESIEKFNKLNIDKEKLKEIDSYLKEFNKLPVDKLPKQANMLKLLDIENIINQFVKNFEGDPFLVDKHLDVLINNIEQIVIAFSRDGLVGQHLDTMVQITKDDISKLDKLVEYFDSLDKLAKKMAIVEKLTGNINKNPEDTGLVKLANALKTAVERFNDIQISKDKLDALNKGINALAKFVVTSAAIMLFGAIMMMVIPIANVFLFAVTLGTFVWGIMSVYKKLDKDVKLSMEGAKAFSLLLVVSAASLLFGGLIMQIVDPIALVEFIFFQTVFMFGLSYVYKRFLDESKMTMEGAAAFSTLLGASAMILIAGSLFFKLINWEDAFKFVLMTTEFVFCMSLLYIIPKSTGLFRDAASGVFDFTVLMLASAITVISGSLLFKAINWGDAFKFIGSTALFVLSMVLMFGLPRMIGNLLPGNPIGVAIASLDPFQASLKGVKDFAILIFATGITLALGAWISRNVPMKDLLGFATSLGLFMLMVMTPLLLMRGSIAIAQNTGKEFAKIIIVSAATMIVGGLLFTLFPSIKKGVLEFALIHGLYMLAISTSLKLLGRMNPKKLLKNAITLMLITVVSGAVLLTAGIIMDKHPSMAYNIPIFTGILFLYVLGMAFSLKILSKIQGNLIKGVIAIGLLSICTGIAAVALLKVGELSKQVSWVDLLNGIAKLSAALLLLGGAYWGFGYLFFLDGGIGLGLASLALLAISGLAYLTSSVMIHINSNKQHYDVKSINKFKTAITAMGDLAKEMIDQFGSLKMMIKLPMVSSAVISLSFALSSIARSIEEYANLKVAVYSGTKVIGYRQLKPADFESAAENVKLIITTLGNAVIDTYDKNPKIFETNSFGTSKFAKVTKSLGTLGPMLSSIAIAVKQYANMQVGEDYKKNKAGFLEPTKYRQLNENDFEEAGKNVKRIIETLGYAVIDTYDKNPEIFETNLFGTSKFAKVTKSLKTLSPLISSIARSVKTYADLKIADYGDTVKYDKDGKPIIQKYIPLGDTDFDNAASNINKIITTLGTPIEEIAKDPEKMKLYESASGFLGIGGTKSKFMKVVEGNMKLAGLISNIGIAIGLMANLKIAKFESYDANTGKYTQYEKLENTHFTDAASNIMTIITTLGAPIEEIAKDPEKMKLYEDASGFLGIGAKKSPFAKVINGNLKLAELISKIGLTIQDYAALKMPTGYDKDGKPTGFTKMLPSDITEAGNTIGMVLKAIGNAIVDTVSGNEKLFGDPKDWLGRTNPNPQASPAYRAALAISEMTKPISAMAEILAYYSMGKFPYTEGTDKNGKPIIKLMQNKISFKDVQINIENVLRSIAFPLYRVMEDSRYKDTIFKQEGDKTLGALRAEQLTVMVNKITTIAEEIKKLGELSLTDCTEKLVAIKDSLTASMNEIASIYKLISDPMPGLSQTADSSSTNQNMDIKDLAEKLDNFSTSVKQLVDIINYSDETGIEGYNIIMTGLDGIISKIAVLPKEDNFKKNVTQLEKYVNAVNRVDLSKIIALNNLGSTLNILATKMGNLDKLTETLATQIATVLDKLVKELKHAEETIKKADVLQKRRHELINKATKEVKSIMNQKMLVEIKQVQDETGIDSGSSGSGSSNQGGSSTNAQHTGGVTDNGSQITPTNDENGTKGPNDKRVTLTSTSKSETSPNRSTYSGINSVGSGISEDNIYNAIMRALRNSKYGA